MIFSVFLRLGVAERLFVFVPYRTKKSLAFYYLERVVK